MVERRLPVCGERKAMGTVVRAASGEEGGDDMADNGSSSTGSMALKMRGWSRYAEVSSIARY